MNIGQEKIDLTRSAGPAGVLDADVIVVSLDTARLVLHQSRTDLMRKVVGVVEERVVEQRLKIMDEPLRAFAAVENQGWNAAHYALIKLAEEEGLDLK